MKLFKEGILPFVLPSQTRKHFNPQRGGIGAQQQQRSKGHHFTLPVLLLIRRGVAKRPGPTSDITSVKLSKNIHH